MHKQLLTTYQLMSSWFISSSSSQRQLPSYSHAFLCVFFLCLFVCLFVFTWWHMAWNILLDSFGQLSWLQLLSGCPGSLSPPNSSCPLSSPHWQDSRRSWGTEISLTLYSTAQQQLKHWCVINVVFLLKPKCSIISDIMKKKIYSHLKQGH